MTDARVDSGEASQDTIELTLTPYHSWANRGPSTMRVWIPATTTIERMSAR